MRVGGACAYQLGQTLLRLVVLRRHARVELILLLPQLLRVGLVLEPGEDLRACQSHGRAGFFRWQAPTSSSIGDAIRAVAVAACGLGAGPGRLKIAGRCSAPDHRPSLRTCVLCCFRRRRRRSARAQTPTPPPPPPPSPLPLVSHFTTCNHLVSSSTFPTCGEDTSELFLASCLAWRLPSYTFTRCLLD